MKLTCENVFDITEIRSEEGPASNVKIVWHKSDIFLHNHVSSK